MKQPCGGRGNSFICFPFLRGLLVAAIASMFREPLLRTMDTAVNHFLITLGPNKDSASSWNIQF